MTTKKAKKKKTTCVLVQYTALDRWYPWRVFATEKQAQAAIANRHNFNSVCRTLPMEYGLREGEK